MHPIVAFLLNALALYAAVGRRHGAWRSWPSA